MSGEAVKKQRGRVENLKPFPKGVSGNPKGRPPDTPEQKAVKKLVKKYQAKYEEALSTIQPAVIAAAKSGESWAVQEIHKVVGAYKKEEKEQYNSQINILIQQMNEILDD